MAEQKPFPILFASSLNDEIIYQQNSRNSRMIRSHDPLDGRKLAWTTENHRTSIPQSRVRFPPDFDKSEGKVSSIWSEIGIVGFRTILDSTAHYLRRVMWFFVLTTCFALMLVQTLDRLNFYLTRPISTTVRFIRNDSLMFPSITLCPYRETLKNDTTHLNPLKLQQLYNKHFSNESFVNPVEAMYQLADIYDVRTLWQLAGWDIEAEISSCLYATANCSSAGRMDKEFTVLGYCLHYYGTPVTTSGHYYGFNIKLCNENEHRLDKFYLMISDRYSEHDIRPLTHGFYLEHGWNKEVAVSLRHFQAESTQDAPCSPDESNTVSHCISRCFHRTLVKKAGCRMPYMNYDELKSVPYCNSTEDLIMAEHLQTDLLWKGRGWHPSQCNCTSSITCSQYLYETSCDTFARHDNCAKFKVYFTDMTYEETKEEFTYDIISLLCDIGGTLGLLLGASVLTMIQFVDVSLRQLLTWITKGSKMVNRSRRRVNDVVMSWLFKSQQKK